jgi:hypothetical protein
LDFIPSQLQACPLRFGTLILFSIDAPRRKSETHVVLGAMLSDFPRLLGKFGYGSPLGNLILLIFKFLVFGSERCQAAFRKII